MFYKEQHIHDVKEIMKEVTKSGKQSAESQYGLRYSVLLSLPYFDPIKFTAIDVMHSLFLGSGKHMLQVWIDQEVLVRHTLLEIENKIKLSMCLLK